MRPNTFLDCILVARLFRTCVAQSCLSSSLRRPPVFKTFLLGFVALGTTVLGTAAIALYKTEPMALAVNRNDALCNHMVSTFNKSLADTGRIRMLEHPEFNQIEWSEGSYKPADSNYDITREIQYSHFDVNNDGVQDLVIRQTNTLRSREYQYLFAIAANSLSFEPPPALGIEATRRIRVLGFSPSNPLRIRNDTGETIAVFNLGYLYPFRYRNSYFIAIRSRVWNPKGPDALQIAIVQIVGDVADDVRDSGPPADNMVSVVCFVNQPE